MTVRRLFGSAFIAWIAAPEPRPPQPISATLIASLPWAWTAGIAPSEAAIEPPTARVEERFGKSRREAGDELAFDSTSMGISDRRKAAGSNGWREARAAGSLQST